MTRVIAQLSYHKIIKIDVELIEGKDPRSFVIQCPVCGTRSRLNEGKHMVTWEMQAGRISVSRAITCPKPACGWHVTIERNVVRDVEERLVDRGMHFNSGARLPGWRTHKKANGSE